MADMPGVPVAAKPSQYGVAAFMVLAQFMNRLAAESEIMRDLARRSLIGAQESLELTNDPEMMAAEGLIQQLLSMKGFAAPDDPG